VRDRLQELARVASEPEIRLNPLMVVETRALVERILAYQGAWNLRINVHPFAEFRIVQGDKEIARDFTPSALRQIDISAAETQIELFWPSEKEARRRWKTTLASLKPGVTVVVSGKIETSQIEVERK
jgi:hypothetical protein